ncbi:heparinase II/III family protein [Flavobacterium sp. NG2]|uniref:heparinase II/III family protein n=1 Tax=Flavobacterium sp. NG2 TaxID=3097547 RepID=UPI002A818413|nr:heparinase II/III family protein [Flavobacterium sp. NG2]WPR72881.1 heparinase II/III family protein [Flavobacterium sp. NG2]
MNLSKKLLPYVFLLLCLSTYAQTNISKDAIIDTKSLVNYLNEETKNNLLSQNKDTEAVLAAYFREKFSERYFYDWRQFENRFEAYNKLYDNQSSHKERAADHMQKFKDSTHWQLPFNYLNGEAVNAYALRHLARQHKMVDVGFEYFYTKKDPKYIRYFTNQLSSLNDALNARKFETMESGNGVYEVFRTGYRVLNWLTIHNMFLGQKDYSDKDQLVTIATLLQHGQDLYENNAEFTPGNHQTRGMSALAMLSILFRDFEGTELWNQRAMLRLEEHLTKEVNPDGFQFERSVHYHISDIETYFYVYQLAQRSNVQVSKTWEQSLKKLFSTLVKIAYPDKSAPVLQDDTNEPWAEKNDISGAVTLGYLLFNDPEFGFLATNHVDNQIYWFVSGKQMEQLNSISKQQPSFKSVELPETKYYIMREGWEANNKMMIISAGLDKDKPDHQHGDMLGVQAMANGNVILPNYQVRYSLPDFEFFKNSMVKNVALVDDELQGKNWTGNAGGSGFGQYKQLPKPKTIAWKTNVNYDFFAGSHDGFENVGVSYSRQVLFVKNGFWIVKDNFNSDKTHDFKQVWQGHYTTEDGPNLVRANFPDASGCDILQLNPADRVLNAGTRGKEWTVVSKSNSSNFNFITVIYPYKGYSNSLDAKKVASIVDGWKVNNLSFQAKGDDLKSLSKEREAYLFNLKEVTIDGISVGFSNQTDVFVVSEKEKITIHAIGVANSDVKILGAKVSQLNGVSVKAKAVLKPGDILVLEKK